MVKRYKRLNKKAGQSTVEYIILVAAILAALIVFLGKNGTFEQSYKNTLTTGTEGMTAMAEGLANSRVECDAEGKNCTPVR